MGTNITACSIRLTPLTPNLKLHKPICSLINSTPNSINSLHLSCRLKRAYKGSVVCCAANSEFESNDLDKSISINLKLPRRRMLVQFTCNSCGERTQRLINRLAYERGLVYVQCAGCLLHHKLADNLGMVVEYNLKDEDTLDHSTESA